MKEKLSTYLGDRAYFKMVALVTLPIMAQNFITNFVSMLDNIMVGSLGTEQMSGVAIVNQILFVFNLAIFGAISGIGIFTAQYYGKGDTDGIRFTLRFKLLVCGALTVLGMLIIGLFGDNLISLFLHQGDYEGDLELTFSMARAYLDAVFWQIPFFAAAQCVAGTMRETGSAIPPMVAGMIAVAINFTFNLILIFGYLGFPALGVTGAAIATLLSRVVEMLLLLIYLVVKRKSFPYVHALFSSLYLPRRLLLDVARKGTPLLFNECFWAAGTTMLGIAYSLHGVEVVAANSISSTVVNLFNISFMALGVAAGIMVGNKLGDDRFDEALLTVKRLLVLSLLLGLTVSGMTLLMSEFAVGFFKTSEISRTLAVYFIRINALFVPVISIIHATYFILRSGGRSMITFLFDSVFVCLLQVPIAFSLSLFTDLDVRTIFAVNLSLDLIKVTIGLVLLKKRIWLNNIVANDTK